MNKTECTMWYRQYGEIRLNYLTLLEAAKKALDFMQRVEATSWDEGGPETLPEVEAFRQALQELGEIE